MFKENKHFGVPWVQSSLRDGCSTAHRGWILDRACPSVFPWHKVVMLCSLAGAWWPSIALLLTEQICVTTNSSKSFTDLGSCHSFLGRGKSCFVFLGKDKACLVLGRDEELAARLSAANAQLTSPYWFVCQHSPP